MECLVTKLKGTVNDDSLRKLDELVIHIDSASSVNRILIAHKENNNFNLRIVGNGYFTDEAGEANLGKGISTEKGAGNKSVYLSQGTYDVFLSDKYKITVFNNLGASSSRVNLDDLNLDTLDYLVSCNTYGNADRFLKNGRIRQVYITKSDAVGDLTDINISNAASSLDVSGSKNISGNIEKLIANNILCKGSFTGIKGIGPVTGDLSKINNSVYFISFTNTNAQLTWNTERPSSAPIVAIEGGPYFGSTLDAMLINQAKCSLSSSATQSYQKTITATGTRTSSSDTAIATLQSKGLTVTVPVATDASSISLMSARTNENFGIAYKGKELIVEPVDLSKMQIYPGKGVSVQKFDTLENAEKFIASAGLLKSESK